MKKIGYFLLGLMITIILGTVLGNYFVPTTFWRAGQSNLFGPMLISLGGTYTGGTLSGGTKYMCIGCTGENISYVTFKDGSGNTFITGGALSGYITGSSLTPYLLIANSGTYFNTYSGTYYNNNPRGYITGSSLTPYLTIANSGVYFNTYSGTYYNNNPKGYITGSSLTPYLLIANSGTYYNNNPRGYITGSSLTPYLTIANSGVYFNLYSGTYYNSNPRGYITGSALTPYLLIANSGVYFNTYSGTYYNNNPRGYITGGQETDPVWKAASGNYVLMSVTGNWNTTYTWVNTNSGNALSFTTNSGNYYTKAQTTGLIENYTGNIKSTTYSFQSEYNNGTKTANFTLTGSNGQKQVVTISGTNLEMTLAGFGVGNYIIRIVQGGAGSKTINRAAGTQILFPGGTHPTLSTGAGNVDILSLYYNGTNWYGGVGLNYN